MWVLVSSIGLMLIIGLLSSVVLVLLMLLIVLNSVMLV